MPGPDSEGDGRSRGDDGLELDPDFLRSRREALWIVAAWCVCLAWTVGFGALFGYDLEGETIGTTLGMPSWIFWGVALPWLLAMLFSIGFALLVMRDQPLDVVAGEEAEECTGNGDRVGEGSDG